MNTEDKNKDLTSNDAKLLVSRSCYLVNECHAKYTITYAVFEDLQMALKYAAEQQRLADKLELNVEYRVRTMPLVRYDG